MIEKNSKIVKKRNKFFQHWYPCDTGLHRCHFSKFHTGTGTPTVPLRLTVDLQSKRPVKKTVFWSKKLQDRSTYDVRV